jgi:putative oxidoreductase
MQTFLLKIIHHVQTSGAYLPQVAQFADVALLLMRLLVALIFLWSGASHLRDPKGRAKGLGMSAGFTAFIGAAEVAGALGITFGVLTQYAALGLVLIMLGAIWKKAFVWKTGFWGEKSSGWHYELMLVTMLLVVACFDGGRWVLLP